MPQYGFPDGFTYPNRATQGGQMNAPLDAATLQQMQAAQAQALQAQAMQQQQLSLPQQQQQQSQQLLHHQQQQQQQQTTPQQALHSSQGMPGFSTQGA